MGMAGLRQIAEISLTQAMVNILTAQTAHQLAQQIQLFDRAVSRAQRTDRSRAMVSLDVLQAIGDIFKCSRPVDGFPGTALLDHRLRQPLAAVQRLIGKAIAVGNPAFVDRLVLERNDTHHLIVLDLNDQIGTGAVMRADALATRQLPSAGAIAEGFAGQRANRADVDHIARQLRVDRAANKGLDLGMFAAMGHAEFHHTSDFLAKTNATRAMDAAAHFFHRNQRTDVLVEDNTLFFRVARLATAISDRQILQLAFTTLVADRAIERMVDQQEFHHALLGLDGFFTLGANDHALRHRRCAGRHRLGRFFHFHQTHAAVGSNRELLVVAEMRDIGPGFFGGMHDHAAGRNLYLLTVEFNFNHCLSCPALRARPAPLPSCVRSNERTLV